MDPKDPCRSLLLTDLYQLTMLEAYWLNGMDRPAVFEFFVRKLPPNRNFLLAAGLAQALDFLAHARFTDQEIDWLKTLNRFRPEFLDFLKKWRFTGTVRAMPEGTVFFENEPILQVTAPIIEAQLVETRLINILQFQTMIASKAARMKLAAPDKLLVDFGLRRAHGSEAGLLAARAGYLAGLAGTSTVLAGRLFNIPVFGTMAHSFVQAHDSEKQAFRNFARTQGANTVLLIDTYDTLRGAKKAAQVALELKEEGVPVKGVRLDSGDLARLSREVRCILDDAGLTHVRILASGNLDEERLHALVREKAPIDGFGIGTKMVVSADYPFLDCAYKLEAYNGIPRRKRSAGKATWPGAKQVFRFTGPDGLFSHDLIALADEKETGGMPLLELVMDKGREVWKETLEEARERAAREIARLPEPLQGLAKAEPFPVKVSSRLQRLAEEIDQHLAGAG